MGGACLAGATGPRLWELLGLGNPGMTPQAGTAVGRRPARSRFLAAVSSGVRSSRASRSLAELSCTPPPTPTLTPVGRRGNVGS